MKENALAVPRTKHSETIATEVLSVALVGPEEERRSALARALAESRRARVVEFHSYPSKPHNVESLLRQNFDVIFVDVDTEPEFSLGLVEVISTSSSAARVIAFSCEADPYNVRRCMEAGAGDYLTLPLKRGALADALDRAISSAIRPSLAGRLLVFVGAKGGSGVTTIACNLGIALAQETDQRTLIIDFARPMGDAALNLGIAATYSTDDVLRNIDRLDAELLHSLLARHRSGISVLAAPSNVPQLEASKAAIDKLLAVARAEFNNVIVDLGSRIDLIGTIFFDQASCIYLVTQPGISELRNSNRLISQFFNDDGPKLEIVINRYEPHTLGAINEAVINKALGKPFRWKIPDDPCATRKLQNTDIGQSLAETPISRISLAIARSLIGHAAPASHPTPKETKKAPVSPGYGRGYVENVPETEEPPTFAATDPAPAQPEAQTPPPAPAPVAAPPVPRVTPTISWVTPDPITYGEHLSTVQLNATASVPGTFVYTPGAGYILAVGTHSLWVTFNPADPLDLPVQSAVRIEVSKATPAISWAAPPVITCGTALSAAELNATAQVPGTFEYTPAPGEVLPPGTHTLSVTFTPADAANYAIAHASVEATVGKAIPVIEWAAADPITYGTALSATQLNASASIPGTFDYFPGAGQMLSVGTHTLTATFNPADSTNYASAQASVPVFVIKAKPVIAWPAPDRITYGTALNATHLNATASIPGTFDYSPGAGEVLSVGTHTVTVTFNPADSANYASVQASVPVIVTKAKPVIAWPAPDPITYGTVLGDMQLQATASVPGRFEYNPAPGSVLAAGEHAPSVIFYPTDDSNYSRAKTAVSMTVSKATPTITWPSPNPMIFGTALSTVQLNATASVPGVFEYAPAAGVVPGPGEHRLSVTFTPTDRLNYSAVHAVVPVTVNEIPPALITWAAPSPVSYGTPLSSSQLNASASNDGTFVYTPPAGVVLPPGRHTLLVSFTPANVADCTAAQATVPLDVTADHGAVESDEVISERSHIEEKHPKTRTYKGAVYVQGDDGQWHLQQK